MLHIDLTCPQQQVQDVLDFLLKEPTVINVVHSGKIVQKPDGELLSFDVAREAANLVLGYLRSIHIHQNGSISIFKIDTAISDAAALAESAAPGEPSEAVIWDEIDTMLRSEGSLSVGYVALLTLAVLIAAIGVFTDSVVLIVGAMVIGPEYGPLSNLAMGLYRKRKKRIKNGIIALGVGFGIAFLCSYLFSLCIRFFGIAPDLFITKNIVSTKFIVEPDIYAGIVAILAGIAGTISLLQTKSSTLVGVLISVTTVPALANISVALSFGRFADARGSFVQLFLNLVLLCLTSMMTMWVMEKVSRRNE